MKLIGIEEHFLTPDVRAAWDATSGGDASCRFNTGEVGERLDDLAEGRLALMDETGMDIQVLGLTAPGFQNLNADCVDLARRTNDFLADAVARRPDRFQGLAALPTPAPEAAARELERAVLELGLKGAMLYGRTHGKHLDHPDFTPIFETAAALGAPLFIHPQIPQRSVREALYSGFAPEVELALSCFAIGWHYEAGIEFVRLVLAGVFDRYPHLQVILGHWGEVALFYIERLAVLERVARLQRPLLSYARQNLHLTASGMFFEGYLKRAVEIVGPDRILCSSDFPYQYRPSRDARGFLERLPLGAADKHKFAHGNWERLTAHLRDGVRKPRD